MNVKRLLEHLIDGVSFLGNATFLLIELYIFFAFIYIVAMTFGLDFVDFLNPLYQGVDGAFLSNIKDGPMQLIFISIFFFMLIFLKSFIRDTYLSFCINLLNSFDKFNNKDNKIKIYTINKKKKEILETSQFIVFLKFNCDIYKSFFDEENEKNEEEIVILKKKISKEFATILNLFAIKKSFLSDECLCFVIENFETFYDTVLNLNNKISKLSKEYASSQLIVSITSVFDVYSEDDNFEKKMFFMNKISKLVKKNKFIVTNFIETFVNLSESAKDKFEFSPLGTYSLTSEDNVSKDYDLSSLNFKNN